MSVPQPAPKNLLFDSLPPVWPDDTLRRQTAQHLARTGRCIVALDDDPTGTQTMHDIWVLTHWSVDAIRLALEDREPSLFILTNARSLPLTEAAALNREIAQNLTQAAAATGRPVTLVSRSDSTLRGHFPGEIYALADALDHPPDGICVIPFFAEGGRFTIDNVHWIQEDDQLIPAAQTPYAQDPVFGYHSSYLPEWIEEKTVGRIRADDVLTISLDLLRRQGPHHVARLLTGVGGGQMIVVNAADYRDLDVFVNGILMAETAGKRFLFRAAASFVQAAAGLPDRPLLRSDALTVGRPSTGGLIVFGSYVPKSNLQFEQVCALDSVVSVELDVHRVLDDAHREPAVARAAQAIDAALAAGQDALLYTSREQVTLDDELANLAAGKTISAALMEAVCRIAHQPRYVIGKGGITSSDLITKALHIRASRVLGQLVPGVPVWHTTQGSRWPGMPFIVFPGNVGQADTVARIVKSLRRQTPCCRILT